MGLLNRWRRENWWVVLGRRRLLIKGRGGYRCIRWADRKQGRGGFVSEKNGPFQLRERA